MLFELAQSFGDSRDESKLPQNEVHTGRTSRFSDQSKVVEATVRRNGSKCTEYQTTPKIKKPVIIDLTDDENERPTAIVAPLCPTQATNSTTAEAQRNRNALASKESEVDVTESSRPNIKASNEDDSDSEVKDPDINNEDDSDSENDYLRAIANDVQIDNSRLNHDYVTRIFGGNVYAMVNWPEIEKARREQHPLTRHQQFFNAVMNIGTSISRPIEQRAYDYRHSHLCANYKNQPDIRMVLVKHINYEEVNTKRFADVAEEVVWWEFVMHQMKSKFNPELFANAAGAPQLLRYRSARLPSKVTSEEATMCLRTLVDVLDNPDIVPINENRTWPCQFCEYRCIYRADWCEHLTTVHNVPDIENHLSMGANCKKRVEHQRQRRQKKK
ncbi:hypothetical protein M3Y96_00638900 [Aphelenchoides besseyi]|nr:hypothetical protein M3Y96_00638900 [Aphelenchoides besseyi]